jgi:peptidoglycan/xylan/chitin deacetylase (PgdA/CDA1 family)
VAWPILKKFGYPFTMFIYTDYIKEGTRFGGQSISWNQLAEMRDSGVDIESHTVSHGSLNARKGKTDEQYLTWLKSEIAGSKEMLEKNRDIQISSGWPQVLVHKLTTAAANRAGLDVNMLDVRVLGANAFI